MLDALGYAKGSDGIRQVPRDRRQVPAGRPRDELRRDRARAGTLDFNGDRQFEILADGLEADRGEAAPRSRAATPTRPLRCDHRSGLHYTKFDLVHLVLASATSTPTSCSRS